MVAVAYEWWSLTRGSEYSDFGETFGILKNWSLRRSRRSLTRGGRNRSMGSTAGNILSSLLRSRSGGEALRDDPNNGCEGD